MRRAISISLIAVMVMLLAAAGSVAAPSGTYSGTASALALSLELRAGSPTNPNGLTAGLSVAEARSTPFAKAKGSGRCEALAPGETLATLPCTDANTEQVEVTAAGEQNPDPNPFKCATPASPAPAVLTLGAACGNAHARITGADPFADGRGTVGVVTLLGLAPVVGSLPQPIRDLLGPTPSALDARIGSTVSRFTSEGSLVKSRADASAGIIVIGGTATDVNGQPDGLIIIEVGDSFAEATWDGSAPTAASNVKVALVTIRVKTAPGTYTAVDPPVPGASQTLLAGLPLQTTITAATGTKSANTTGRSGTASASAKAVEIVAAQGIGGSTGTGCTIANCDGGLALKLAIADASIEGEIPIVPELATTGRDSFLAIAGLVALLLALRLTQSLRRRSNSV